MKGYNNEWNLCYMNSLIQVLSPVLIPLLNLHQFKEEQVIFNHLKTLLLDDTYTDTRY